ncbi:hypothetical protein [Microtetraspora sp. NBRC 13810]|uniref:hypothetical protein n=1 Tax=Microtetraspora sp. NBRC 13810 TaxID=3030990 RepID=UPI0025526069|nr:hypothetical protein [Microtetraspora sp. NBRC 13810]
MGLVLREVGQGTNRTLAEIFHRLVTRPGWFGRAGEDDLGAASMRRGADMEAQNQGS